MWYPLSLEMKMMRPQLRLRIEGRYSLERRAPLSTFASKNRCQSASEISSNGLTSKMPRLFTRTSTTGWRCTKVSATEATARSPANPMTSPWVSDFIAATAPSTAAGVRPLTITVAPSRASEVAMALPMPAVEPLTSAIFLASCKSIGLQRRIHRHGIELVHHALFHHEADVLHDADVIDRVARHGHHIG